MSTIRHLMEILQGRTGPMGALVRLRERFGAMPRAKRAPWLGAATLVLVVRFVHYGHNLVAPAIRQALHAGPTQQIAMLQYFDVLVLIGAVSLLLTIIATLVPAPESARGTWSVLRRWPLAALVVGFATTSAVLLFLPTRVADVVFDYDALFALAAHPLWPPEPYILASLLTAAGIAIFLFDASVRPGAGHWWLLPLLLLPNWWAAAFVLPVWAFFAGQFPSRYWTWLKPLCAVATCAVPVLAYPASQPIRPHMGVPIHNVDQTSVVPFPVEQAVYDIQRHPDKAQFLIGGGVTSNWARVERGDDGTWRMVDQWEGGFHWDYAAADFARNRGFIHDGAGRRLRVLQLDPMGEIATVPVPLEQFPTHDVDATFLMHAYNPATRRLFVADLRGSIYRLDTETLTVERTGFVLPHGDRLVAIREDAAAGELLVLYNRALFVLDAVTLEQREAHELPFQAEGMAYDETTRTFYLARPMDMSLAVVPRDTMRIARSIPAPAGVRVVTLDPERGRVFLGAITGVVEIRDLSDGRLVRRARLTSWIHGMAVFGEEGDAVITVGENLPIIWHYGATKPGWDPIDTMLRWTEAAIRWGFGRWGSPIRPPGKMVDRDALVGNETIGLLMPDNGDRAILQAHFRQGGYDVRATDDPARLAEWRSKSREDGGVAVIVADPSLLGIGRGGLSEATLNDAAGAVSFAVASPPTANDCRRRLVRRCLASPFDRFNVLFTVREMITYGTLSGPSDTSAR